MSCFIKSVMIHSKVVTTSSKILQELAAPKRKSCIYELKTSHSEPQTMQRLIAHKKAPKGDLIWPTNIADHDV